MSLSNRQRCGYCGNSKNIPPGYDYKKNSYECLKAGIGVGVHQERRKWQRQMGLPVDPEYISGCPRNKKSKSRKRRSKNRKRKRRSRKR